jgi:hypothetical protein
MAASTNATRVFMGTAWTSQTLLARELRAAQEAERRDGRRRVFRYDADDVRQDLPAYGAFVDAQITRLGRGHPLVKTQFFNEEIDAEAGMFNAARRALMAGDRPAIDAPQDGHVYAFCIDVGGMQAANQGLTAMDGDGMSNSRRDSTTLSVVEIDLSSLEILQAPTYRVVRRHAWTGQNHLTVFGQLKALAATWRPQYIVIDATGVGEGLWAMLDKAFPTRVIPVKFSASTKSEIGYRFLAIIETGRFKDCYALTTPFAPPAAARRCETARTQSTQSSFLSDHNEIPGGPGAFVVNPQTVNRQYVACQAEVLIGPQKTMRWGVPEGTRDENGEFVHDDFILADSLTAVLDRLEWAIHFDPFIIPAHDPLEDMSHH